MTTTQDRAAGQTRVTAVARCATTPDCGYLHNAFGPGCPHCTPAARSMWSDHALCGQADPEAWFPEPGIRTVAKTICARCPVRYPCLLFALATNQSHGIWGGLSTAERDELRLGREAA